MCPWRRLSRALRAILGGRAGQRLRGGASTTWAPLTRSGRRARKKRKEGFPWLPHSIWRWSPPQDIFYSGNARQIILPGLDGAYGVLPNHEPMVTAITAGIVRYQDQEGRWHMCVASDGCVEVMPERVIVLAATIERAEDIDRNRALAAKHRAEEAPAPKAEPARVHPNPGRFGPGPGPLKGKARQMRDKEKRKRFSSFCM